MDGSSFSEGARMALLVDGDNLPGTRAGALIRAAAPMGHIGIRRVYLTAQHLPGWAGATGFRHVVGSPGKNATDMAMAIDAVDLHYRDGIRQFAIASSDRDFAAVALYLCDRGCTVLGIGEEKAPAPFRHACSRFSVLPAVPPPAPALSAHDEKLREVILATGTGGVIPVAVAGCRLHKLHQLSAGCLPGGGLRAYVATRPDLYAIDPKGPDAKLQWLGPAA